MEKFPPSFADLKILRTFAFKIMVVLCRKCTLIVMTKSKAKVAQLVEHDLAKVGVASSNLVFRSISKP